MATVHTFATKEALADAAAAMFADVLGTALDTHGRASAALSGGSSPKPIYERLAQAPLAWNGVGLTLVDERWVAPGQPGSNADFLRGCTEGTPMARAQFIPLYNDAPNAAEGVQAAEQALALIRQPLDLCVLGMGSDGHTASWFPQSGGLEAALDADNPATLCAIDATGAPVAGDHTDRITLTYSAVAKANHVVLLLPSADKMAAWRATADSDLHDAPVRVLDRLGDRLVVFGVEG